MNKKINTKLQLNKVITQKYFEANHLNDQQAIFEHCLAQNSLNINRNVGSDCRARKSRLQAYAHDIINKLHFHEQYCYQLFEMEIKKYEDYYRQIIEVISEQYDKGRFFIDKQRHKINHIFQLEKSRILNFKKELEISEKYKNYDYQDRIRIFQHNVNIEINIIRINVPKIEAFHKDIHKYFIHYQQINPFDRQQSANNPTDQPQAPIDMAEPKPPQPHLQADDLLGCDQELGAKASEDTIRRRKYDVGRQNVIKEEDESDDTSSIVSDC